MQGDECPDPSPSVGRASLGLWEVMWQSCDLACNHHVIINFVELLVLCESFLLPDNNYMTVHVHAYNIMKTILQKRTELD